MSCKTLQIVKTVTHKMVKHTQTFLSLSVFDHFVGLALKGLSCFILR